MAQKIVVTVTCDRCAKYIRTITVPAGTSGTLEATPGVAYKIVRYLPSPEGVATEEIVAEFRDLCEPCDGAVRGLLRRLTLEEDDKRKRKAPPEEPPAAGPAPPATEEPSASSVPTDPHRPF